MKLFYNLTDQKNKIKQLKRKEKDVQNHYNKKKLTHCYWLHRHFDSDTNFAEFDTQFGLDIAMSCN